MGVWNVDGDQGNVGRGDLVGDHGGDVLFDLELDDEIDSGAHELIGIQQGGLGVVAVVQDEEVDPESHGGLLQGLGYKLGEGHVAGLAGIAEAELLGAGDLTVEAIRPLHQVAAMDEGLEDPVDGRLGDLGLSMDGFERHGLLLGLKQLEYVEGLGEDRNEVEEASCFSHRCLSG